MNFGFSYSQTKNDSLVLRSCTKIELMLTQLVSEKILNKNFKFIPESLVIEDRVLPFRINFSDSNNNKPIYHWISYNIISNNLVLTKLDLPFDNNGELIYSKKRMKKILKPYLMVLKGKSNVDLEKAIEIAKENGLMKIYSWSIDYEKKKLVWTLKSKLDNDLPEVIKINSKNENILSKTVEISIN